MSLGKKRRKLIDYPPNEDKYFLSFLDGLIWPRLRTEWKEQTPLLIQIESLRLARTQYSPTYLFSRHYLCPC